MGRISVTNNTDHAVKIAKWVLIPGQTIDNIPLPYKEAFLNKGCDVERADGTVIKSPQASTRPVGGASALFTFENVSTAFEYSDGISVVIPSFNRANVIEKCVRSIFNQTHPNCEVVVVDDGSIDNTPGVLMKLRNAAQKNQVELTYIILSKNSGISAARNLGTLVSKHDNIIMLDSDDIMMPGSLSNIAEALSDKEVDIVYGNHKTMKGEVYKAPDFSPGRLASSGCYILGVRAFRKRIWELVSGFDETLTSAEDLDILIRFEDIGAKFKKIDRVLCMVGDYGDRTTKVKSEEVNNNASEARTRSEQRRGKAWPIRV